MWWILAAAGALLLLRRADQAKAEPTSTQTIAPQQLMPPVTMPARPARYLEAAPGVDSLGFFAPDAGYAGGDPELTVPKVAASPGVPGGAFDPGAGGSGGGGGGTGGGGRRMVL